MSRMSFRLSDTRRVAQMALDCGELSQRLSYRFRILLAGLFAPLLLIAGPALSQTAPDLGSTSSFAVVSETFSNTTAGTLVNGDVCFTTGPAVVPTIVGAVMTPCPPQTGIDQTAARAELDAQSCTSIGAAVALNEISIAAGPPGEFPPGCYSSTGAMSITTGTTVTLNGDGVYIFRPAGALDPAAGSSVVTANGVCLDNVFWTPGGGTTIGANAAFVGTVFRGTGNGLSITLGDSATLAGRALAFGSTVTTANNTITVPEPCPQPGTIIIEKQTNPAGSPQSFTFTGDAAGDLQDDEQIMVTNLLPGNYTSTESPTVDWELTDIVCNDADSSGDIGTATANFAVDAGETVTCVFINTSLTAGDGTITILKQATPSDTGTSFDFTGDLGNFSLIHGQTNVQTRPPGVYAVSETLPTDWQLDSAICSNGSPVDAITLAAGENVTCVFTNSAIVIGGGTITIIKQATPSDTGTSFDFTGDLGNFSLMHGESNVQTRPPGVYTVSETLPAGWQLDSAICDDGSPVDAIVLDIDDNVTCTFTNSLLPFAVIGVPLFSNGGVALLLLTMSMIAVFFLQRSRLDRTPGLIEQSNRHS